MRLYLKSAIVSAGLVAGGTEGVLNKLAAEHCGGRPLRRSFQTMGLYAP